MSVVVVIPARYGSSRFPGKMLAADTGKPLIQHVLERASLASSVDKVIVATDDERIQSAVLDAGGTCVMTKPDHPNGTSRIAEVVRGMEAELVVNVQGDEPELEPTIIDRAVEAIRERPECPMATIASPFTPEEDPGDPNIVKVVVDRQGCAMYFSRSLIPHRRPEVARGVCEPLKHVGLYVYRPEFLQRYISLPPTPNEQVERLEQLRVLEYGYSIAVAVCQVNHHGIDTPEQYAAFVERMRGASPNPRFHP